MMRTLIICIDRDDDIGNKVGIKGPVVGRADNLDAATKLALNDPEDSDTNTIFGAIQIYDKLKAEGVDVEVVSICGDQDVGVKSDTFIADQLDDLSKKYGVKNAIVVTDGAEDEFVLPLIESRFRVDSVRRVVVKQSQNLESIYYIIKELFSDPKISRPFFIPIGLACLIYAISVFAGYPQGAIIAIMAFVGVYMLFRGFGLEDIIEDFTENLKRSFYGGRISFVTYVAAAILVFIGITQGLARCWELESQGVLLVVIFINASVWWFIASGLLSWVGRIIDSYLSKERVGRYWVLPFFLSAAGVTLWGGSACAILLSQGFRSAALQYLMISIVGAVIIAFIGVGLSAYIRMLESRPSSS
ncbi:MAG: DUF373 family protein [Methanocellales archaeon]|nr:DUF373 family protein [Methanocellales archaeon]MDD3421772.1 DUF373 family protein [Methanocellales archaeon]MDD4898146.1 DUF373 family protein [Methanocellales archaeon]